MRVLLFLPKAFEHMESSAFIDVFGWAEDLLKIDIQLDTCGFTPIVKSTFNVPIVVDTIITTITVNDYDVLAIPGGFGDWGYLDEAYDERLLNLIREFNQQGKWIASVCMGAMPLARSGILQGKQATTYHLCNSPRLLQLQAMGVNAVAEELVIDSNIITSCGPKTAVEVAFTVLEKLTSKKEAKKVKDAMGYL